MQVSHPLQVAKYVGFTVITMWIAVSLAPFKGLFQGHMHACLSQRFYSMFSQDFILSSIDYRALSNTCQGGEACLEAVVPAAATVDSSSDEETEIVESCVSTLSMFLMLCLENFLLAGHTGSAGIWLIQLLCVKLTSVHMGSPTCLDTSSRDSHLYWCIRFLREGSEAGALGIIMGNQQDEGHWFMHRRNSRSNTGMS